MAGLGDSIKDADTKFNIQKEDTVQGQLESFNDYSNPIFKRAGSLGTRMAASRGLTNSTIATGMVSGQILDKATDIAKTDATNRVTTGINNAGNASGILTTRISAEANLEAARLKDKGDTERLGTQIESNEREGAAGRKSQEGQTFANIEATKGIEAAKNALNEKLTGMNLSSQEKQQLLDIASREGMAAADLAMKDLMSQRQTDVSYADIESREGIEAAKNALNEKLTTMNLSSQEKQQLLSIASNEGMAAADLAMKDLISQRQTDVSYADIESREGIEAAKNALNEKLTTMNLSSQEKQQLLTIASNEGMAAADLAMKDLISQRQTDVSYADIESREGIEAAKNALSERLSQAGIDANVALQINDIASKEGMAAADRALRDVMNNKTIKSQEDMSELDRANRLELTRIDNAARERVATLGNDAQIEIEKIRANFNVGAQARAEVSSAWDNLQQGIANIDPNATPESQRAQFSRLTSSFDARMSFLGINKRTGESVTPGSGTPGSGNPGGPNVGNINVGNIDVGLR